MRTAMRAKAFPGEDPRTLPAPEEVAPFVVSYTLPTLEETGLTYSYRSETARKLVSLDERRAHPPERRSE
jgi:hypothetical protein